MTGGMVGPADGPPPFQQEIEHGLEGMALYLVASAMAITPTTLSNHCMLLILCARIGYSPHAF
jgi:hypothetical protein